MIAALVLLVATVISPNQFAEVQPRMTRHHVQQVIFDGYRGEWVGKYADEQGDLHLLRKYKMPGGDFVGVAYRKPVNGSHFRVQADQSWTPTRLSGTKPNK